MQRKNPNSEVKSAIPSQLSSMDRHHYYSLYNSQSAERFLKERGAPGRKIIRPSSRGEPYIAASYKMYNGEIRHTLFVINNGQLYLCTEKNDGQIEQTPLENKAIVEYLDQMILPEKKYQIENYLRNHPNEKSSKKFVGEEKDVDENKLRHGDYLLYRSNSGDLIARIKGFDGNITQYSFTVANGNVFASDNFDRPIMLEFTLNRLLELDEKRFAEGKYRHQLTEHTAVEFLRDKEVGDFVLRPSKEGDGYVMVTIKMPANKFGESQYVHHQYEIKNGTFYDRTDEDKLLAIASVSVYTKYLYEKEIKKSQMETTKTILNAMQQKSKSIAKKGDGEQHAPVKKGFKQKLKQMLFSMRPKAQKKPAVSTSQSQAPQSKSRS